jgi:hypothetical protein
MPKDITKIWLEMSEQLQRPQQLRLQPQLQQLRPQQPQQLRRPQQLQRLQPQQLKQKRRP